MSSPLRPIMFVGTCSDAGKSVLNAAFCRIFKQDGYAPAPFKAQNMSLNSFSTRDGGEMGRAQVVQAEACGIAPHTDMNPVLLKPTGDCVSQVILNGRPVGNYSAREYFEGSLRKEGLFAEACQAFDRLAARFNPIVLEGAGSISELNLRDRDIVNMRMARHANAATFLVADIDRGGVFASVYGSIMLLDEDERRLMKGMIINKFRGDISLFDEGREMLHRLTGVPVVGVIPYFRDIVIEEEDSVVLNRKRRSLAEGKINVAIILLRHMSNFTDFDALEADPRFNPFYTNDLEEIRKADVIVLPGSKNTLDDLLFLRENKLDKAIIEAYKAGRKVVGICGGYQMMGTLVSDPLRIEGDIPSLPGLALLPQTTTIEGSKVTRQSAFAFLKGNGGEPKPFDCKGYEIHMGRTIITDDATLRPVAQIDNGRFDGYYRDARCWGCYLHGLFDNAAVRDHLAEGILPDSSVPAFDYDAFRETQYDRLAELVRRNVDMDYIYRVLKGYES